MSEPANDTADAWLLQYARLQGLDALMALDAPALLACARTARQQVAAMSAVEIEAADGAALVYAAGGAR